MSEVLKVHAAHRLKEPFVVYRAADFLVLSKPAGMLSTGVDTSETLLDAAHRLDPEAVQLHATSRLDRQVSGLVTFARTDRGNRHLLLERAQGRYERRYLGLVLRSDAEIARHGRWTWPIGIDPNRPKQRRTWQEGEAPLPGLKPAETGYQIRATHASLSVLLLTPHTGRTHQLRLHAAAAGMPLLGDVPYGGKRDVVLCDGRVVGAARVMLHCMRISFTLNDGRDLVLSLGIPDDMQEIWRSTGGEPLTANLD
ncbi:MAG: RNA pseudouridine synthase [Myxococcales bacterium]|nr:RNA pseudouridine synthase [Myxococcales bacterium]MCB9709420.1 RNA pseudouridine synthase [Myxococcales bacterium]